MLPVLIPYTPALQSRLGLLVLYLKSILWFFFKVLIRIITSCEFIFNSYFPSTKL